MRSLAAEVECYFYKRSVAAVFLDVTKKSADGLWQSRMMIVRKSNA
jgi:hypothetical protein